MKKAEAIWHAFWRGFHKIHLYPTRAEAVFKAMLITVSWIGGVRLSVPPELLSREIGISYYLFALALIMEYAISLFTQKGIVSKILPFLLCAANALTFFWTTGILVDRPFVSIEYRHFQITVIFSLFLIWFDAITMLLITPVKKRENELKEIESEVY